MTISGQNDTDLHMEDASCLTEFYRNHPKLQDTDSDYEGLQSRNNKIFHRVCDITSVMIDAIVCSTQTNLLLPPYGLCSNVWRLGGPVLKQTCREREKLEAGHSFLTNGYDLPANYIIFTAGPTPEAPYNVEERLEILRENYMASLNIVKTRKDIRKVAFPCLGTGGGGLQLVDANRVAVQAIRDWLDKESNRSSVDVILLCMFSEDQWEDFYPELLKAFPYELDLQGNNLEVMHDVSEKHLMLPSSSVSTNNLCYKYEKTACKVMKNHFHRIVDTCAQELKDVVSVRNRFRNCAILKPKGKSDHQVIIYNSDTLNMLEVQVIRFNDHIEHIRQDICHTLKKSITDYFQSNLENITSCQHYLRCHQSSWGQINGLWEYAETVESLSERRETCDKHEYSKDFHPILRNDMLEYWTITNVLRPPSLQLSLDQRRPREPDENSIPSETGSESSGGCSYLSHKPQCLKKLSLPKHQIQHEDTPSSAGWSVPSTPGSFTWLKTQAASPTEQIDSSERRLQSNESCNTQFKYPETQADPSHRDLGEEKKKGRKKDKKLTELGNRNKTEQPQQHQECLAVEDSGNESQFSSQASLRSQGIENYTLCRNLVQKDLMKLAKHMGSYQKRIGLCLELTEIDIQNAIAKAERDIELQGFYIIKKWMNINDTKADVASLLKVYHECDIDVYQLKQEFGIN